MVLVEGTAEREKLDLVPIPEQPLSRFVEPFGDMIEHGGVAVLLRGAEFVF